MKIKRKNHLKIFLFANNQKKKNINWADIPRREPNTQSAHINSNQDSTKYNQQSNYNLELNFDFCVAEQMKMWKREEEIAKNSKGDDGTWENFV